MNKSIQKKAQILKETASTLYFDLATEVANEIDNLNIDDRELDIKLKSAIAHFKALEDNVKEDNNVNRYIVNCGYLLEIQELVAYIDSPTPNPKLVHTIVDTIGELLT